MKIGLSLAGGGVRGAAHIGALQALKENNIEISMIAGTSIGSIIAALYAMEYTPEEMLKLFRYFSKSLLRADPKYLMSNLRNSKSLFGSGVISGQAIEDAIQECARLKGLSKIEDLQMPIAIPTVDIKTGKKYVFTNRKIEEVSLEVKEGETQENKNLLEQEIQRQKLEDGKYLNNISIGKAVRASCSYPAVFSPMDYKEYKFVDGGVLDNVPTGELKVLGAEKLLTIKFPPKAEETPKSALDVFMRSMDIVFDKRDTKNTKNSDYIINIDVTSSGYFDIKKIDYCYEKGYQTTMKQINKIKKALEV